MEWVVTDTEPLVFATAKERKQIQRHRYTQPFIAWDSEGTNEPEPGKPQNLSLFGASTGERIIKRQIRTVEALEMICAVGAKNPHANHIAFAFNYDVDQILNSLLPTDFRTLRAKHSVRYQNYRLEHFPRKWFMVTKYAQDENGNTDWKRKLQTVKIDDMIGFFQSTFLKAIKSYIPDHPLMADLEVIEAGKAARNNFSYSRIDEIEKYWSVEIKLMAELAEEFRERCYRAGLFINQWYGPGVIANYLARKHKIKNHMTVSPAPVHEAAKRAYMGGRFELFKIGRIQGPVWSIDINSAYPAAITHVPSLTEGRWVHVTDPDIRDLSPFGIYRIEVAQSQYRQKPGVLFNRKPKGQIGFPHYTNGWYWTPEAEQAVKYYVTDPPWDIGDSHRDTQIARETKLRHQALDIPDMGTVGRDKMRAIAATKGICDYFRITEGWIYVDYSTYPYAFIGAMYEQRKAMKAANDGAQVALKLAMNSVYGKTAQRKGWNRPGRIPGAPIWHQLEWAGYITSWTRARLFDAMRRMGYDLIAVETDGIYTTMDPKYLDIEHSTELGGWEITCYESMLYLQNGMYFYEKSNGEWGRKFRGFDADSFDLESVTAYLQSVKSPRRLARSPEFDAQLLTGNVQSLFTDNGQIRRSDFRRYWPPITGHTTRFINYALALHRKKLNMRAIHRRWITEDKEARIDSESGKRYHSGSKMTCAGCYDNLSPWHMPHDLSIGKLWNAGIDTDLESYPHDIPWDDPPDDTDILEWRTMQELEKYQ